MEPQRFGFADQMAQHAMAGGKITNEAGTFFINADGNEMAELLVLTDDAQAAVPCSDEFARGTHNPVQHCLQAKVLSEGHHSPEQALNVFLGPDEFVSPLYELTQ
jgi:hypothetical protein